MAKKTELPLLSQQAAAAYERFVRLGEKIRKAMAFNKDKRAARDAVLAEMDELGATRARLPDGRILQRIPKTRQVKAQQARVDEWQELIVVDE